MQRKAVNTAPVTVDGKTGKPILTRIKKTPPIKLDTLRNIRDEMGRIYREARAGKMATQDLTRFCFALDKLRDVVIAMEIEGRLELLEGRLAE